jgi:hypothetical protein
VATAGDTQAAFLLVTMTAFFGRSDQADAMTHENKKYNPP